MTYQEQSLDLTRGNLSRTQNHNIIIRYIDVLSYTHRESLQLTLSSHFRLGQLSPGSASKVIADQTYNEKGRNEKSAAEADLAACLQVLDLDLFEGREEKNSEVWRSVSDR